MKNSDMDTLFFCSFRYALGRRTYIVHDVATLINDNKNLLTIQTKAKMVEEIYGSIAEGSAGMKMDVDIWQRLAELLEDDIQGIDYV